MKKEIEPVLSYLKMTLLRESKDELANLWRREFNAGNGEELSKDYWRLCDRADELRVLSTLSQLPDEQLTEELSTSLKLAASSADRCERFSHLREALYSWARTQKGTSYDS